MSARFDHFDATPNGSNPPAAVRLRASLRSHAGEFPIILVYSLSENHNVWFHDAPENPGRMKRITYSGQVTSDGVKHQIVAPLLYGDGPSPVELQIRATLLRGAASLHRAIDHIRLF